MLLLALQRLRVLIPILAAALLALAVVAIAGADRQTARIPGADLEPNGAGPQTERNFVIFRTPRNPSVDALPPPPPGARVGAFGIDSSQSRRIESPDTVTRVWAVPAGNDSVCIAYIRPEAVGPGFSCGAADGEPLIAYLEVGDGKAEVFGLVRDGYDQAEISFAGGSEQRMGIRRNAFGTRSNGPPRSVGLTGSRAPTEVDLTP